MKSGGMRQVVTACMKLVPQHLHFCSFETSECNYDSFC